MHKRTAHKATNGERRCRYGAGRPETMAIRRLRLSRMSPAASWPPANKGAEGTATELCSLRCFDPFTARRRLRTLRRPFLLQVHADGTADWHPFGHASQTCSGQAAQGAGTLMQHSSAPSSPAGSGKLLSSDRCWGRTTTATPHYPMQPPRTPRTPEILVLDVLEHVTFMCVRWSVLFSQNARGHFCAAACRSSAMCSASVGGGRSIPVAACWRTGARRAPYAAANLFPRRLCGSPGIPGDYLCGVVDHSGADWCDWVGSGRVCEETANQGCSWP